MPLPRIALAAALLALAAPAVASADRLVTPPASPPTFQSTDTELVAFDGYVYFAANDGVNGNELWRTDGTPAGTTLVKDFKPGLASASGNPRQLTVVGNRLFVIASNADDQYAAYVIDPGGPPQLTTVPTGAAGSLDNGGTIMGQVNGKVLLDHYDGGVGDKLYSLGASGTVFQTITSAAGTNVSVGPVATVGGFAYFGMTVNSNSATEPYRTDGTTATMVKDIVTGINGSQPTDFIATGNRAYFTADDGVHGRELWVTDGSDGGTQLVHEHHPLNVASSISDWAANGNVLYYIPNDPTTGGEVWRTEGTDATTRVVKDLTPGPGGSGQNRLFAFKDGYGLLRGSDVYASDGTDAGTTLLGSVDLDGYGPAYPTVVGSKFYFRGGFSGYGSVVWRSDGAPVGTFALTAGAFDGDPRSPFPFAGPFAQLGDKIIFTAQYPHAVGDPVPVNARRIYVIDTSQADETRRAATAPSISGTAAVGQKLTGDKGAWTLEPNTYAYKWLRNGTPIPNATATTYTPSTADAGAQISFRVTASGIGGPNVVSADSAAISLGGALPTPPKPSPSPVSPVSHGTPSLTLKKAAKLTGTVRVGQTIKLKLPTFAQSKVRFSFRWYADGKLIKRQSASSLKLRKALKGKRITAKITVRRAGYRTRTLTLGPTGKVKSARR